MIYQWELATAVGERMPEAMIWVSWDHQSLSWILHADCPGVCVMTFVSPLQLKQACLDDLADLHVRMLTQLLRMKERRRGRQQVISGS